MPGSAFSEIQATAWPAYRKVAEDTIFNSHWGWNRIMAKSKKIKPGAPQIIAPFKYQTIPVYSVGPYATVASSIPRVLDAASFNYKYKAAYVSWDLIEEDQNAEEQQAVDLLAERNEVAMLSYGEELTAEFFGDGSGNGGLDLTGLAAGVENTATPSGVYGGIDRSLAANAFWRNKAKDFSASFATSGLAAWASLYNRCSRGSQHPDLMISDRGTLEQYEAKLQGVLHLNYVDGKRPKDGDMGFNAFSYKGAELYYDEQCPGDGSVATTGTGRTYFLTTKTIEVWVSRAMNLKMLPERRPDNQPMVKEYPIIWGGQLMVLNPRFNGVMFNISS